MGTGRQAGRTLLGGAAPRVRIQASESQRGSSPANGVQPSTSSTAPPAVMPKGPAGSSTGQKS